MREMDYKGTKPQIDKKKKALVKNVTVKRRSEFLKGIWIQVKFTLNMIYHKNGQHHEHHSA